ncbi:putative ribonuclease H-like domain-containing protein [Tanacetum coccineum]
MVPRTVLSRSGPILVNTVRPVNIVQPRTAVNNAGPMKNVINNAYSTARRLFNQIIAANNCNFTKKLNIVKGTRVNTARLKAVLSAVKRNKGNKRNAVKASACWVWRPKHKILDHVSRNNGASMSFKRFDYIVSQGDPSIGNLIDLRVKVIRCDNGIEFKNKVSDSDEENVPKVKPVEMFNKPSFSRINFVKSTEQVKSPRKISVDKNKQNTPSPRGNKRNWNQQMSQKLRSDFKMFNKACHVCGSFDHLKNDCNNWYNNGRFAKPVWSNVQRVNKQNFSKLTHHSPKRNMAPKTVLTRSSLILVNTARPVNTVQPRTTVDNAGPMKNVINNAYSTARRPFNKIAATNNSNFTKKVNIVKGIRVNTARPKAVLSAGNPQQDFKDKGVIDSRCSKHMTGNRSYLTDYEEIDGGFVSFGGNSKGGKITRKVKIRTGKLDFKDVYFVKELKFNLFSVSQICDKKNNVLFTDTKSVVLSPDFKLTNESHVLLKVPRKDNMYSVDLKNVVPQGGLTCLFAKATIDESNLWHRRLGRVNFKTMNKLVKGNRVRGLPSKLFEINQTCVACQKGKQHRASLIRYDNGTEFKNRVMNQFYEMKGIKREFSVARTPQQNGVAEATRTIKPVLNFMRPFGCLVTILNTIDHLGKFDGKADEGFFVGYSTNNKAFKVFNSRTRIVKENLHVQFSKNIPNIAGSGLNYLFDIDALTKSMNYKPVVAWKSDLMVLSDTEEFKPSGEEEKKDVEDPGNESGNPTKGKDSEVPSTEEPRINQEKDDNINSTNNINTASDGNSTNNVNAVSSTVNAAGIEVNAVDPKISIELPNDPNMPELEDIVYSDDDEDVGAEADMNNLDAFILQSLFQLQEYTKIIHSVQQRINHKDFQNCLFACFLSQEEPKKKGNEDSEVPSTEEPRVNQEKDDNVSNTNNVNTARVNSTNTINTVSLTVNAAGIEVNVIDPKSSIELSDDPNMPELEDIIYSKNDEDVGAEADMNNLDAFMPVSPILTARIHKDHPVKQFIGDLHSTPQTRRMTKNLEEHGLFSSVQQRINHKYFQNCLFACFLSQEEPKKVIHALKDPSWIEAMQDELLQFKLQKVWTLVDLPNGKRVIRTKWVYRIKKDERGIMIKNKARLVTQGYTQEEGINYDEVFAPVSRIEAIRLFLAYASFKDFVVYQMDVKSAFLYGKIEEEVYVCQPPGFEDPDFPDRVYKVEKALYGLHQAPRAWYETLSTYLLDNGFQRGKIDKTLFIRRFEKMMHKKFQMSSMGELTFFLGLQVKQKEDGIFISQDKYVTEILKKFGFTDVKTASTPMETHKPLLKDVDGEDVDEHLYRSMIGSLMYLTSSRPGIMFAVCACTRYQVNLKVSHLHAVKRIFRYLKGQPKLGLWYPKDSPFDLVAYTDSDYARTSLDKKSTTRDCQFLGCRLILWQCKKQTVVANSTTKSEYIPASNCLKNPVFHSKTKHIEIRHHFIRDSNEKKLILMIKIHTDQNVADLLTKAFDVSRFQYLIAKKPTKSERFEEIVDFLNANPIKYALTINLTIYCSCVKQFWDTIKAKKVNGVVQLQALVDKKKVIITESTIRRDLQLEDSNGVDCLPNDAIFE